jgi:sulfur carrier protein
LRIQVNGDSRDVNEGMSIPALIASLQLKADQIAIELNQRVLRRTEWQSTILREDDKLEIVHFVGGGG